MSNAVMKKQGDVEHNSPQVVVVGMGNTGLSCTQHLLARGQRVILMDTRELPPMISRLRGEFAHLDQYLGGLDAQVLASADQIVLSPGLSIKEPAIANAIAAGVEVIGDIELFARTVTAPVLAVTGSNGKSTVTAMLVEMLRAYGLVAQAGGNLSPPALDLLTGGVADVYVLELSSFQLETTTRLDCEAATIINLSPDHMDRYLSYEDYVAAKARVYRHAKNLVVNLDDPKVLSLDTGGRQVVGFSLNPKSGALATLLGEGSDVHLSIADEKVLPLSELNVVGRHNQANALAAMALAHCHGVSTTAMANALQRYRGLPHRCQFVHEHNAVRWINDSKGTNVDACIAAIRGLQNGCSLILIVGGDAKSQDFSSMTAVIEEYVHTVVLIGRDANLIEQALPTNQPRIYAGDLEQAVVLSAEIADPGMTVLFSPACASFDMFKNYQERGESFIDAVRSRYPS